MRATRWKDSTPEGDRKHILSIHPETPFQKFGPVLNSLKLLDIPYTMTMTTEGDDPAPAPPKDTSEAQAPKANAQSQAAPANTQPTVKTSSGRLPITMTVLGGDLRLVNPNGDSESLDEMEAIIEQLALAIPPRTAWTVYYLRSADVTETATMLEQLFPSSSVSTSLADDGSFFWRADEQHFLAEQQPGGCGGSEFPHPKYHRVEYHPRTALLFVVRLRPGRSSPPGRANAASPGCGRPSANSP
jgi:hypothetical protein